MFAMVATTLLHTSIEDPILGQLYTYTPTLKQFVTCHLCKSVGCNGYGGIYIYHSHSLMIIDIDFFVPVAQHAISYSTCAFGPSTKTILSEL